MTCTICRGSGWTETGPCRCWTEKQPPADTTDVYLGVVKRLEPDITSIDHDAALASIAISLKRIADVLGEPNAWGEVGTAAIAGAIVRGLRGDNR